MIYIVSTDEYHDNEVILGVFGNLDAAKAVVPFGIWDPGTEPEEYYLRDERASVPCPGFSPEWAHSRGGAFTTSSFMSSSEPPRYGPPEPRYTYLGDFTSLRIQGYEVQ